MARAFCPEERLAKLLERGQQLLGHFLSIIVLVFGPFVIDERSHAFGRFDELLALAPCRWHVPP